MASVIGPRAGRPDGDALVVALGVVTAAAVGAALAWALDPDGGRRRRALIRDQLVHAARRAERAAGASSRDLGNRARGVVADLSGRLVPRDISDSVLAGRVHARVSAVLGRASPVRAAVDTGCVTLSGPVLAEDVDRLLRRVRAVPGVRDVDNRLDVHAEPGNVPGLQGRPRTRRGEVFQLVRDEWSPSAGVAAGVVGVALVLWALGRLGREG